MKKCLLFVLIFVFHINIVQAATQIKVSAVQEFSTEKPTKTIDVKVLHDYELGNYNLSENTILTCRILDIIEPKRGKRDATFYVMPVYYNSNNEMRSFEEEMYGKYSKRVLNKEELKKIPSFKTLKKLSLSVGNHFITGLSTGYAFVEGVVKNEKDGRIKSGVVNAYEESPLSYISTGEQINLQVGDEFYFVFRTHSDD